MDSVGTSMQRGDVFRTLLMLAISIGAHLAAAFGLVLLPAIAAFDEPRSVELAVVEALPPPEPEPEVVPPEPEPPPPAPEPEVVPPPQPVVTRPRPRPQAPPEPAQPAAPPPPADAPPPPPAEETIEDFSGMTLTNDSGDAAWRSNVGSGAPMDGPIGRPNAVVTGRNRRGVPGGVPGGTGDGSQVVAAADLSRQPGPPAERLRELLRANYPREAQQLGIEGHTDVRVHVSADGSVRVLGIVRETHEGFGEACRRTIRQGGRWSPPLDRQGRPVETVTAFRCTFTIAF